MKYTLSIIMFCLSLFVVSQNNTIQNDSLIDPKYKEDQFYIGVSYNLLSKMPDDLSQSGFSIGVNLGKIFDIPLNKERNFGLGIGAGYGVNFINHNLGITETPQGQLEYQILDSEDFTRNRFSFHMIELPFEIRWRTSNATSYKFWRIYAGMRIGYVIASNSKLRTNDETYKIRGLDDLNKFQYGLTLSAGYDTWNAQIYYGLNTLFNDVNTVNGIPIDMKLVKIGLIFYLL